MKKPHLLILTYWSYKDALIQTYTLPYVRIIRKTLPQESKIFLLTIEQPQRALSPQEKAATKAQLAQEGIDWISIKYASFGLGMMFRWGWALSWLWWLILLQEITHIHVWCTPPGAIGYILSLCSGAQLILDSYEPHAEASVENGDWTRSSWAFRILFFLEKRQSRRAKAAIANTKGMQQYAQEKYGATFQQYFVKPACVNLEQFNEKQLKDPDLLKKLGWEGKIIGVYAGKIGGIYLEREIFDLLKAAQDHWGDKLRVLLLTGTPEAKVKALAVASGVDPNIIHLAFVSHEEINKYIGLGDFAINPVKPVPSKRYCTSVKDGEYWALGLPVIIPPNISDDSDIIREHGAGAVLEGFTPEAYQKAVIEIDQLLQKYTPAKRYAHIRQLAERYRNYENARKIYGELYGG